MSYNKLSTLYFACENSCACTGYNTVQKFTSLTKKPYTRKYQTHMNTHPVIYFRLSVQCGCIYLLTSLMP